MPETFWLDLGEDGMWLTGSEVQQYRREEAREEAWRDGFTGEDDEDG